MALRIAGALWLFWLVRGRWREVQRRVELAFSATSAPAAVRATALVAGANVSLYAGDFPSARRFSEEAVALSRASEDRATLARALTWRGWAGVLHPNQAAPFFEEAVSLCRDTGDDIYLVRGLNGLGNVAALSHSAAAARTHMRQAIDLARRTGNGVGLGHALTNAGIWVSALSGAFDEATKQLQEGLYLARARGDLLFTGSPCTAWRSWRPAVESTRLPLSYSRKHWPPRSPRVPQVGNRWR
jgi:tetratricopeptide (TPR) repeat protein